MSTTRSVRTIIIEDYLKPNGWTVPMLRKAGCTIDFNRTDADGMEPPITVTQAVQLSQALGAVPRFWLDLQHEHACEQADALRGIATALNLQVTTVADVAAEYAARAANRKGPRPNRDVPSRTARLNKGKEPPVG